MRLVQVGLVLAVCIALVASISIENELSEKKKGKGKGKKPAKKPAKKPVKPPAGGGKGTGAGGKGTGTGAGGDWEAVWELFGQLKALLMELEASGAAPPIGSGSGSGPSDEGSTCSCNGELNEDGGGECWNTMKSTGKSYCYVNEGVCQDQKKSASMSGWFWSYQACEVGSGYNPSLPDYLTTQEILGVKPIAGTNNYVEYYPGNMNLILTSPHGGKLKPFPYRKKNNSTGTWGGVTFLADKYSKEIAMGVIKQIENITGSRPHFVVNNVYRNCLDPNRDEHVGAQKNDEAITAFREYHAFIDQAMMAAVPPQLIISSSGAGSTIQKRRMGNYYLSVRRYNGFPVYSKVDNSQVVFVNSNGTWSVTRKLHPKKRALRNLEKGGASASPPVRGWEYWDSGTSSYVSDPDMKVESMAPPYVTVSSSGAAASGQPARMGRYHLSSEIHNNHPVYKKEDNSQVMFVNNEKEWVISNTIDPNVCSLRNTGGLTATPPQDGWKFCNSRWNDDNKLRVFPPTALLIDMHGHNHDKNSSEIGYTLNSSQLNEGSYTANQTSIFGLIDRSGISAAQMVHGPKSLGALFNDAGYDAFPSPDQQSPGNDSYFKGGYTLGVHGSRYNGGPVDALQVEAPRMLRRPKIQSIRDRFILALAHMFQQFYLQFYDN